MKPSMNAAGARTDVPSGTDQFRNALRYLASGVSLITTTGPDGRWQGMVATAVTSVTAEPPTILVCLNRTVTMHGDLITSRKFCVNVLGQGHIELSRRFSSAEARGSRFDTGEWTTLNTGAPVLDDALSALDCRLENVVEVGSHSVLFGKVMEIKVTSLPGDRPLLYYDRQYGGFAST